MLQVLVYPHEVYGSYICIWSGQR